MHQWKLGTPPLNVGGAAEFKVYLVAENELKLYSATGPRLALETFAKPAAKVGGWT